jgi:CRP/FNR family transcriptional regulator, cyclic AMP receptor protein
MSTNVAMLGDIPVFSLLDHAERETLAQIMDCEHVAAGKVIFDMGDVGDCLYILRSGHVHIYVENTTGEKIVLGEFEPGEVFGEISLLDGGPRTATAIAMEDSELFVLTRDDLQSLITEHPHAAIDLLTMVGRRLRTTDELLRSHVSRNANVEEDERMTFGERVADKVAAFGGSWGFIFLFGTILFGWMLANAAWLNHRPWDPYPFILLNLGLSTLAALQAPVIMMSQNRQSTKDRIKSDLDYEVNMKAELEVAHLHNKIDKIYERIQEHWAQADKEKKSGMIGPQTGNDSY